MHSAEEGHSPIYMYFYKTHAGMEGTDVHST